MPGEKSPAFCLQFGQKYLSMVSVSTPCSSQQWFSSWLSYALPVVVATILFCTVSGNPVLACGLGKEDLSLSLDHLCPGSACCGLTPPKHLSWAAAASRHPAAEFAQQAEGHRHHMCICTWPLGRTGLWLPFSGVVL